MIVKELIEILQKAPQDAMVLVQGYEDGWDELDRYDIAGIIAFDPIKDYYGQYEKFIGGNEGVFLWSTDRHE